MSKINFSVSQIELMDKEQSNSFYWNLKRKCINFLINKYHIPNGNILDIGCGTGFVVSGANFDHEKYLGLDAFPEAEFFLKKNLSNHIGFTTKSIDSIQYQKFDTILLLDVLEHVIEDKLFISDIKKLMHSKSNFIITVPAHKWLFSMADINSGHVRRYNLNELNEIFNDQGLNMVFISSFLVLSLPLMVISRLFSFTNYDHKNEHLGLINKILFKLNSFDFFIFKHLKIKIGGTLAIVVTKNEI